MGARNLIAGIAMMLVISAMPTSAMAQDSEQRARWNRPAPPFRITGDLYYVGTSGLASYLLTGPRGHVLIDGGLPESAPLIAANIRALGFKPEDVRILLINHAHYDHAGGLAALKALTHAQLYASPGDRIDLALGRTIGRSDIAGFPPVKIDHVLRDGEEIVLGPIRLTTILTPGHTPGATSWLTTAGGHRVLFASSLSVAGLKLVGDPTYPNAAADFTHTFARLALVKADIFLNYHAESFDLERKRAALAGGKTDAFIDPGELPRQLSAAHSAFDKDLASQRAGNAPL